tara:strand:+ start:40 stop:1185 length:1146 start_codon:yes stop_codon:yes gene_type:complete
MKLFKSLLVAPATLGLLAPMAATANEVTINDFAPAEELAITNSRVDGLEARMNNIEAGSFSETTTAEFGVNFYAGITNDDDGGDDQDDNLTTGYDFAIGLTTSFTGEDTLAVNIEAGNSDQAGIGEFAGDTTTNEALTVDEITYTFPLGEKTTIQVGDNNDASALFTTACVYGGPSDTLDACGNVNAAVDNGGVMLGAAYDFGNGLTAAVGYAGDENDVANEEGIDAYGVNVAYTGDSYGLSFTLGFQEDGASQRADQDNMDVDTFYALNAYYTPDAEGLPSISVGYEVGEDASVVGDADGLTNFFVGLGWDEVGPGELGVAMGTRVNTVEDTDAQYMYEAYYAYPLNDGMTITPLVFVQDVSAANTDDTTGVMVKTSFSF